MRLRAATQLIVWNWSPFSHRNKAQVEVGSPPGLKQPDSAISKTASEEPSHSLPLLVLAGASAEPWRPQILGSSAKSSGGHGNWGPAEGNSYTSNSTGKQGVCERVHV